MINLPCARSLADKDRRNDGFAQEINQSFSIPVPRGRHVIRLANTGGDWLTVDRYTLRNGAFGASGGKN